MTPRRGTPSSIYNAPDGAQWWIYAPKGVAFKLRPTVLASDKDIKSNKAPALIERVRGFGTNAGAMATVATGVTLDVARPDGSVHVRAQHVIACDGAFSPTRAMLDVALVDLDFEEPWLVVDVEMDGPVSFPTYPGLPIGADVQQLSVMLCDPHRPTTIVPGRSPVGSTTRWR